MISHYFSYCILHSKSQFILHNALKVINIIMLIVHLSISFINYLKDLLLIFHYHLGVLLITYYWIRIPLF